MTRSGSLFISVLAMVLCVGASILGCVAATGGWDVEAVLDSEPAAAAVVGQRLGDLTPYPALLDGRLVLVACRFATNQNIHISGGGPGWPGEWVRLAVAAVNRSVPAVNLEIPEGPLVRSKVSGPVIEIMVIGSPNDEGPSGLGDTLADCDVSVAGDEPYVRGLITRAEIRMRRSQVLRTRRTKWASEEEWIGALMHEFGHALGFSGHVVAGNSLLLLEQSRLRLFGRRAIAGQVVEDATLEALYELPTGRLLGKAKMSVQGQALVDRVLELVSEWNAIWGAPVGPIANVGDRKARIQWRWPLQGRSLELTFPGWKKELRRGGPVTMVPSAATRRALRERVGSRHAP